ncbi:hypothetical protein [Aurantivibrio plasticivorans]
MSAEFNLTEMFEKVTLPAQDLAALSFSASNKASSVKAWAEALPATRITHTGVLLYKSLPEIPRLETSADNRLAMLEAVRPYVQHCIQGLARGFLNQPLILPEGPMKTAVVAQALQKHMCVGYLSVLKDIASKSTKTKPHPHLELVCHRAIVGLGLLLFRSFQLYRQTPEQLWLELHTCYRVAEEFALLDRLVADQLLEESDACTTQQAYMRIILLAASRPNQMRQIDVSATYQALESWAYLAKLAPTDSDRKNLYVLNLAADIGPLNKARFSGSRGDIRELDMSQLLTALRTQREAKETDKELLKIPKTLSVALLDHLEQAWSTNLQRAFERQPTNSTIEASVGLSNIHHHIINGMSFEEFLGQDEMEEIDFGSFANDPWNSKQNDDAEADDHPIDLVQVIDTSPGGYCLEWRKAIPAHVRAGEIIGLREKGRHRWGVGVIRWVQQQQSSTRLGIQILAPKATPYAAAIEQPTGEYGDYMRILLLPELKAANQPATLITAFAPFQEYNRLELNSFGEISQGQLTRRIFSSGSISQFQFRADKIDAPEPHVSQEATASESQQVDASSDDDFSSAWDD